MSSPCGSNPLLFQRSPDGHPHSSWRSLGVRRVQGLCRSFRLAIGLAAGLTLSLTACAGGRSGASVAIPADPQVLAEQRYQASRLRVEAACGIGVERLTLTSSGYMLDFRYRILDPQKASRVTDRTVRPYLQDPESGVVFAVPSPPKIGPLRQSVPGGQLPPKDKVLFILFANPGQNLRAGNRINVVLGDCRLEGVPIQ